MVKSEAVSGEMSDVHSERPWGSSCVALRGQTQSFESVLVSPAFLSCTVIFVSVEARFLKVKFPPPPPRLTAGEGAAKPLYEVRGARCLLHHLPGLARVQRLGQVRGHHHAAKRHGHGLPQADLQGEDHPVHVDRDADHGLGSR